MRAFQLRRDLCIWRSCKTYLQRDDDIHLCLVLDLHHHYRAALNFDLLETGHVSRERPCISFPSGFMEGDNSSRISLTPPAPTVCTEGKRRVSHLTQRGIFVLMAFLSFTDQRITRRMLCLRASSITLSSMVRAKRHFSGSIVSQITDPAKC